MNHFSHEMCKLMAFPMFALNLMLTTLSNGGPKKSWKLHPIIEFAHQNKVSSFQNSFSDSAYHMGPHKPSSLFANINNHW
jgi:hypothetical protein